MEQFLLTRKIAKGRLTKIQTSLASGSKSPAEASTLMNVLEKAWEALEDNFNEIAKLCSDQQFDVYQADHDASLDKYLSIMAELQTAIGKRAGSSINSNGSEESKGSECRLPKLTLPSFSGKIEDWQSFKCAFTSAIVNKDSLSGADKLQYLIGQVSGEAKKLIQHLPICDENFNVAWTALHDQYQHTRELVFAQIRKMVKFPVCTNEQSLQNLLTTFKESISQLENLGQEADNNFVVYHFVNKLDPTTFKDYNQTLSTDVPEWSDVVRYMANRCRAIAVTPGINNNINVYHPSTSAN